MVGCWCENLILLTFKRLSFEGKLIFEKGIQLHFRDTSLIVMLIAVSFFSFLCSCSSRILRGKKSIKTCTTTVIICIYAPNDLSAFLCPFHSVNKSTMHACTLLVIIMLVRFS